MLPDAYTETYEQRLEQLPTLLYMCAKNTRQGENLRLYRD